MVPTFLPSIFLTLSLLFLCLLILPLVSLFILYGVHTSCMGYPLPIVCAKWSRVFRSFTTSSERLKTALSLLYNNNNVLNQHTPPSRKSPNVVTTYPSPSRSPSPYKQLFPTPTSPNTRLRCPSSTDNSLSRTNMRKGWVKGRREWAYLPKYPPFLFTLTYLLQVCYLPGGVSTFSLCQGLEELSSG